jgi:hypothetical protein
LSHHHGITVRENAHGGEGRDGFELGLELQQDLVGPARGHAGVEQALGRAEQHHVLEIEAELTAVSAGRVDEGPAHVMSNLFRFHADEIGHFARAVSAHGSGEVSVHWGLERPAVAETAGRA